ncbi:MAG: DUF2478 domain-containing protein [Granulosicoccaceae bacterium]
MSISIATNNSTQQSDRRIAAIVTESADRSDEIIDRVISNLQDQGQLVAGLRQRLIPGVDTGCGVRLEDIQTGELHRITQNLGNGSISCNIDTAAVERLALNQCSALNENINLLFVNRFGKQESEGRGFRGVMERAIELDIPVLTAVRKSSLQAWIDYGGDWVTTLPVCENHIQLWCESAISTTDL